MYERDTFIFCLSINTIKMDYW